MGTWIFGYGSLIHKPGFAYTRRVEGYIRGYRRVWWQGSTDHRGTPEAPGRTVTLTPDPDAVTWGVAFELAGTPEEQQQVIQYLEWREKQYDVRLTLPVYAAADIPVAHGTSAAAGPAAHAKPAVGTTAGGHAAAGIAAAATEGAQPPVAAAGAQSSGAAAPPPAAAPSLRATAAAPQEHTQPDAAAAAAGAESSGAAPAAAAAAAAVPQDGPQPAVAAAVVYYATNNPTTNTNYLGPASQEAIAQQIAGAAGPSGPNYEYVYKLADAMRQMGVHDRELYELEGRVRAIRGDPPPVLPPPVQPLQPAAATAATAAPAAAAAAAAVQQPLQAAAAVLHDVHLGGEQPPPPAPAAAAAAADTCAASKAHSAAVLEMTATCTSGS